MRKNQIKFKKMSDSELQDRYRFLRNNNSEYFLKNELSQLINFLMTNDKAYLIC